jgi:dimethylaniline monooxygenase (N-oxide forming)
LSERVCVIGAGSSGIASCQVLGARGIDFDCFEVGSEVGGNWRYMNDNEMSSAYRSLHINTSRRTMAYATYPMPVDYADYPDHFQIAKYFDDYVDRSSGWHGVMSPRSATRSRSTSSPTCARSAASGVTAGS